MEIPGTWTGNTAPAQPAKPPIASTKKVKILLVDDTPENLIALDAALASLGEELVLARSGTEALRHLLENDFAAILLDVKMPDMDGFETAELIRSRLRSRDTPILFLTGYKNEEHLFRGYDLGAVDFLFKPIVPEILRSKVAVFVELSRKAELLQQQATALAHQAATLQKAEQRFRSLLEAAPDAMVICDQHARISLINSRTEALFSYPRSELLGQPVQVLIPRLDTNAFASLEHSNGSRNERSSASSEIEAVRQDSSAFPAEISTSPLKSDEGLLVIISIRDITGRKQAEQARAEAEERIRQLNHHLEDLNASLEARVLQRTEELLRSNDELEQFAYVASHDLQEPLRTVTVYTQLLARQHEDLLRGDAQLFMTYIADSARRMQALIHDLLDFSRVGAHAADRFTATASESALFNAIENLKVQIEETSAVITHDPLPEVFADPIQLTRLFQNLTINAIKYRKQNETPRVHIAASASDTEWMFSVRDNGIGIEPQYSERVFGIFKRLHGRDNPGTGMGLAISKKIVNNHGGRIWVESQLGQGATFHFTLPQLENKLPSIG